jgi:hypothetical protein
MHIIKTREEVITQCKITTKQINAYYNEMPEYQDETLNKVFSNNLMINKSLGGKEVIALYHMGVQYTTNLNRSKQYCFDDGGWEVHPWSECILVLYYFMWFKMRTLNPSKKAILAGF